MSYSLASGNLLQRYNEIDFLILEILQSILSGIVLV